MAKSEKAVTVKNLTEGSHETKFDLPEHIHMRVRGTVAGTNRHGRPKTNVGNASSADEQERGKHGKTSAFVKPYHEQKRVTSRQPEHI